MMYIGNYFVDSYLRDVPQKRTDMIEKKGGHTK